MIPGQKLIAKDPCIMNDDGRPVLTVGKEYPIVDIAHEFYVINDEGNRHAFDDDELIEFFQVPLPSFGTWQPIETAPKDGSKVLLHGKPWGDPIIGQYHTRDKYWTSLNLMSFHYSPTIWMPLPELPKL